MPLSKDCWELDAQIFEDKVENVGPKSRGGNFHHDLTMIDPLTRHARERANERNISLKDAVNRYAVKSNGVIVTVYKKNEKNKNCIFAPLGSKLPPGHVLRSVDFSKKFTGHVIGSKGSVIQQIQETYGVQIKLLDHAGEKRATTWGPEANVERACLAVQGIIAYAEEASAKAEHPTIPPVESKLPPGHVLRSVDFSKKFTGHVIGSKGSVIQQIQDTHRVQIKLLDHAGEKRATIWGPETNVERAFYHVQGIVTKAEEASAKERERKASDSSKYQSGRLTPEEKNKREKQQKASDSSKYQTGRLPPEEMKKGKKQQKKEKKQFRRLRFSL